MVLYSLAHSLTHHTYEKVEIGNREPKLPVNLTCADFPVKRLERKDPVRKYGNFGSK